MTARLIKDTDGSAIMEVTNSFLFWNWLTYYRLVDGQWYMVTPTHKLYVVTKHISRRRSKYLLDALYQKAVLVAFGES